MLEKHLEDPAQGVDFVKNETIQAIASAGDNSNPKQELLALKQKHGTYQLAPMLTTPSSMWQKEVIALCANSSWRHHASRAKDILSPEQVAGWTVGMAEGGWKNELYDLLVDNFYDIEVLKKLYPPGSTPQEVKKTRMEIQYDFITKLIGKRAASLASSYLVPPIRYAGLVIPTLRPAAAAKMQAEFEKLLACEAMHARGTHVEGLDCLHFLSSSYCRLAFLLNERDLAQGVQDQPQASTMLQHSLCHLGDTACIESTHSSAKDLMKEARHNFKSRVNKYHACISSKVLSSRQTDCVKVSEWEMATAKVRDLPPVVPATHPSSHKLSREFQHLMRHKAADHFWHSTTPASLYEQVVSLEWVLTERGGTNSQNQLNFLI